MSGSPSYSLFEERYYGMTIVTMESPVFTAKDVYEVIGRDEIVATFIFKDSSNAYLEFGGSLNGFAHFTFEDRKAFSEGIDTNSSKLKIRIAERNISSERKCDLIYEGIPFEDISSIEFSNNYKPKPKEINGFKCVPNIVNVEVSEFSNNIDFFKLNYLIEQFNRGNQLAPFEREELVGTYLAINSDTIDSRILKRFNFDASSIFENIEVAYHYLSTKSRMCSLTEAEKEKLKDINEIKRLNCINAILLEIKSSKKIKKEIAHYPLDELIKDVSSFKPQVLLYGQVPIYWDQSSYAHIIMRHIEKFQFGSFKVKTVLPYKQEDLSLLIEKVLSRLSDELALHFKDAENTRDFVRSGRMAIQFNGDYFNLRIDHQGRLYQFHSRS